jgi:Antibiotic biosynthesis monooxygenase
VYARLARYAIEPEHVDDAVEGFRGAGREISQLEGFRGGHILVDYDEGSVLTMTLWEDRNTLDRSEVRAAALRQNAVRSSEGEIQSVTVYRVPFELGAA